MKDGVRDVDRPAAQPAYERIALARCRADHWPSAVLACVSTSEDPVACLAQLPDQQANALDEEMSAWNAENINTWDLDMPIQLGRPHVAGARDREAVATWMIATWFAAARPCFEGKPVGDWSISFAIANDGSLTSIAVGSSHELSVCVAEKTRALRVDGVAQGPTEVRAVVHVQTANLGGVR